MKKLANIDSTNSPIMKEQRMATGDVNIFRRQERPELLKLDQPTISLKFTF